MLAHYSISVNGSHQYVPIHREQSTANIDQLATYCIKKKWPLALVKIIETPGGRFVNRFFFDFCLKEK